MPELPIQITNSTSRATREPSKTKAMIILGEEGSEVIGAGEESLVYVHPNDYNKVIAISRSGQELSPLEMKEIFYTHQIFNILFPHNFPKLYAAFGKDENRPYHAGTVRERIIENSQTDIQYPFSSVVQICGDLAIHLATDFSDNSYMIGADGGEYYVDLIRPINASVELRNRLSNYMRDNNYIEDDILRMQNCMDNIMDLENIRLEGLKRHE